jgi:hypothetical protein
MARKPRRTKLVEKNAIPRSPDKDLLDLWVLNTTVLRKDDVSPLPQFREHSLLVTIRDATLELKHRAYGVEERFLLGRSELPESLSDVLDQLRV